MAARLPNYQQSESLTEHPRQVRLNVMTECKGDPTLKRPFGLLPSVIQLLVHQSCLLFWHCQLRSSVAITLRHRQRPRDLINDLAPKTEYSDSGS
jgi:hypothetical protein